MESLRQKKRIMDGKEIDEALSRIASDILKEGEIKSLAIFGIRTRGVYLAQRIAGKIREAGTVDVPVGILDITLYRDDLSERAPQPLVGKTEFSFDLTGRRTVIVDDVLYTGRTFRAAMDELMDFGRPRLVQLAVLIDRGHRELPIKPDYVGKGVLTSQAELVDVRLREIDKEEAVYIMEKSLSEKVEEKGPPRA